MGQFNKVMEAGLNFKIPLTDVIAYKHSLKEQVLEIDQQHAITRDNVKITIDGVLYFKIQDGFKASYTVQEPIRALSLLA